jgi:hypothetical protein
MSESPEKTKQEIEDELARQRLEEEMKKIQLETEEKRKAKMRALIGEDADDVGARKKHVDESVQKWAEKGTHHNERSSVQAVEHKGDTIKAAKEAYADNLKANTTKGKNLHNVDEGEETQPHHLSQDATKKFERPSSDVPTLFGSKSTATSSQAQEVEEEPQQPQEASYKSDFASIDSEEVTMVGLEKHIKITGTDLHGRKMTKTKIILPKVEGKTVQQGAKPANPENQLEPKDWDGTYHSLEDIQQRRAEGIDKHNREQYLSPEDFEAIFKMTKEAFAKSPKWKRDKVKKDLYLF